MLVRGGGPLGWLRNRVRVLDLGHLLERDERALGGHTDPGELLPQPGRARGNGLGERGEGERDGAKGWGQETGPRTLDLQAGGSRQRQVGCERGGGRAHGRKRGREQSNFR